MNIVDFNKERYKESKEIADDLLQLIHFIDIGKVELTKEEVIRYLRTMEFRYRQKVFKYQNKIK